MNHAKNLLIIFLASFFILGVISINFVMPADTYAHPAYGFTPAPPGGGGGDTGGGDTGGGDSGDTGDNHGPTDYVWVQLDRCDLQCSANYADAGDSQASGFMSSVGNNQPLQSPALVDSNEPEVLVRVRLVHRGSGFIAEDILSDAGSTRISVPYPGQWDVFMTNPPKFATAKVVDATGLNLAQLHANLANAPISLGMVEANSAAPQRVKCPIACVIEAPPVTEEPAYLPETGDVPVANHFFLYTKALFLVINGLLLILARQFFRPDSHNL